MGVLQYFFLETHDKNHRKIKEFRAPGAKRVTHAPAQKTPRKYTFGTCTLAIVMVSDFPNPDSLPGGLKKGPPADTGTYYNIWALAEDLVDQCVKNEGEVGWQATGARNGIGVFIWATGSQEDILIEADQPRFVFPAAEVLGNGSAAEV